MKERKTVWMDREHSKDSTIAGRLRHTTSVFGFVGVCGCFLSCCLTVECGCIEKILNLRSLDMTCTTFVVQMAETVHCIECQPMCIIVN